MKIVKEQTVYDVLLETGDPLEHCPFCGSSKVELKHTWTASYWLECDCGAELHDVGRIGNHDSKVAHLASARRVLKAWNARATDSRGASD